MTEEEIKREMNTLAEKFIKLRKIAVSLGEEMDKVSQQYHTYETQLIQLSNVGE